ncbi:MAG TPA: ABC transporter permease, partial [Bdellovibrionota bacterium]|nr:ABC transporter permease [Bdellovibrionota bacterium]
MLQYILKRILAGLLTVFAIATLTFTAMHLVPGDPISGQKAMTAEIRANLEAKYGLDQPVLVQYAVYIKNMLQGDFGISFTQQNRSVNDIISSHFPISAMLGIVAVILATISGVIFGSVSALFRGRYPDRM